MKILYTKWGDVSKEDFENIQELEAQEVQDGLKNHHGDFLKDLVITGRLAKLSEMYFQLGMRPQAVFVGDWWAYHHHFIEMLEALPESDPVETLRSKAACSQTGAACSSVC